jgi:hypothetical protein
VEPFPSLHTRRLSSRTAMFYVATGITPAMCMRLTNVGSQYLAANLDRSGEPIDGARTYRCCYRQASRQPRSGRSP